MTSHAPTFNQRQPPHPDSNLRWYLNLGDQMVGEKVCSLWISLIYVTMLPFASHPTNTENVVYLLSKHQTELTSKVYKNKCKFNKRTITQWKKAYSIISFKSPQHTPIDPTGKSFLSIQSAPRITSHVKDISLLSLRHFDCMVHGHSSTLYHQAKPSSILQNSFIYAVRPFIETFTEKFQGDLCRFYSLAQPHPVFVHYITYFLRIPKQFSSREDAQGVTAFAIEGAFNSRWTTGLPIIRVHA